MLKQLRCWEVRLDSFEIDVCTDSAQEAIKMAIDWIKQNDPSVPDYTLKVLHVIRKYSVVVKL